MAKILLIADTKNWIFDRHCNEIKKRIAEHDFDIVFTWHSDPRTYQYQNYDLIYQLDYMGILGLDPPPHKTMIGLRNEFVYQRRNHDSADQFYRNKIQNRYILFHVVNKNMLKDFESVLDIPLRLVQHGVDTEVFKQMDRKLPTEQLIVGSCGNATSGGIKGFDIVQEACAMTGCCLKIAKQDLINGHLSKEQMVKYYNSLDIYCSISEQEGLNNSLMEAGATGLLVITTNTGAVDEIIRDGENGFVVERSVDALSRKIQTILADRNILTALGTKLLETITSKWAWSIKIEEYRRMFQEGLTLLPPHGT